jgi:hypothetical protein
MMIKTRRMRLAEYVARMGEMRKPERKRLLESPSRGLEDNIKMDLRKIRWECVGWNNCLRIGTGGGLL